jgi:hypothetical protein
VIAQASGLRVRVAPISAESVSLQVVAPGATGIHEGERENWSRDRSLEL